MSEAPNLTYDDDVTHEDATWARAKVTRLRHGLLGVPDSETFVTLAGSDGGGGEAVETRARVSPWVEAVLAELADADDVPLETSGVADLRASVDALHDQSQALLGTISAVARAPRDIETALALATYIFGKLTCELEAAAARAVSAATTVRDDVLGEIASHRELVLAQEAAHRETILDELDAHRAAAVQELDAHRAMLGDTAVGLVERLEDADVRVAAHCAEVLLGLDSARVALVDELERTQRLFADRTRRSADKMRDTAAESVEAVRAAGRQVALEISAQLALLRAERAVAEAALTRRRRGVFRRG